MSAPGRIGVRSTRQREAVAAILARSDAFRSAQDLHSALREDGASVGLTTVYRALQSMAEAGAVDVLRTEVGESLFRLCSDSHHHHLVCRDCGRTVEVQGQDVEEWAERTSRTHGFTAVDHTVELIGLCAGCSPRD